MSKRRGGSRQGELFPRSKRPAIEDSKPNVPERIALVMKSADFDECWENRREGRSAEFGKVVFGFQIIADGTPAFPKIKLTRCDTPEWSRA